MIHEFKYNKQQHLKEVLGTLLLNALHEPRIALRDDWMIVPVPLHSIRKRERGFNQSLELATVLQRGSQYPLMDGLRRTRYTTGQAHLNRKGRLENLRGAISLTATAASQHWFAGKSVLLIDDVLTTGATAHECAQVLKKQGAAERVVALSVARG
jgi:ComF family protein